MRVSDVTVYYNYTEISGQKISCVVECKVNTENRILILERADGSKQNFNIDKILGFVIAPERDMTEAENIILGRIKNESA